MVDQTDSRNRARGGVRVRDYTMDNRYSELSSRLGLSRLKLRRQGNPDMLTRSLGVAGMGLGLFELLAPRRLQKMIGVRRGNHTRLLRLMGIRELLAGLLTFYHARPRPGAVARIAGDALDLGLLARAFAVRRNDKKRLGIATAAVLGITAMDVLALLRLNRKLQEGREASTLTRSDLNHKLGGGAFHVSRSITINREPEVLYAYWRNFENLPTFMYHLEAVYTRGSQRSHWVAKAPAGRTVVWDAEITQDVPNRRIAWQSLAGADVQNSGSVTFEPASTGRGTVVRVEMDYRPPAGALGRLVAQIFGEEPAQQVAGDLARFKQVMEIGEVMRSEGAPQGLGQKLQPPGRPAEHELPRRERERGRLENLRPSHVQVFDIRERSN